MHDRFKHTFDQIHADPQLCTRTEAFVHRAMMQHGAHQRRGLRLAFTGFAAAIALCFVGCGLYFTPTASISVDINPSIQLDLNRFDHVIDVQGYNDDGQALAQSLDITFQPYAKALDTILQNQMITDCLAQDETLSITVAGADPSKSQTLLAGVRACTAGHSNVTCAAGNREQVTQANDAGLSLGKYREFLKLQALDPTITPDMVRGMSMREIRDLIATRTQSSSTTTSGQSTEQGTGQGAGRYGYGAGYGRRHRGA